jgi:GTP-binding protein YchF
MKIGIVGLPYVGKTSLFNALTQSEAETGTYTAKKGWNVGSVKVPDERLAALAEVFNPKQVTPTNIDYVDIAGVSKGDIALEGLEAGIIAELREVDALTHIVRLFEDDAVPHVDGDVDPKRDIETIDIELAFADLGIIDNRLDRLSRELRTQKIPALEHERAVLERCKDALEGGTAIRELPLSPEDERAIRGYGFLTQKPLLLVLNINEDGLEGAEEVRAGFADYAQKRQIEIITLSARLEMELAQLDAEDAEIFRADMGLNESAPARVIDVSYRTLGLITFFTVVSDELRAWTLKAGMTALEAAGTIHTDMARGFIRSETIHWADLVDCGDLTKARDNGLLRLEGKDYPVSDGDVLTIRFNV